MAGTPSTETIAWYGATVATIVLVWDIWKWSRRHARLRVRIKGRVFYHDGEILKTEKTEHGEVGTMALYYHIEIANIGELPTTILGVSATTRAANMFEQFQQRRLKIQGEVGYFGFIVHNQKTPPHTLGPGEVWSCRVGEDKIRSLWQHGRRPKVEVTASCWDSPRLFKLPTDEKIARAA